MEFHLLISKLSEAFQWNDGDSQPRIWTLRNNLDDRWFNGRFDCDYLDHFYFLTSPWGICCVSAGIDISTLLADFAHQAKALDAAHKGNSYIGLSFDGRNIARHVHEATEILKQLAIYIWAERLSLLNFRRDAVYVCYDREPDLQCVDCICNWYLCIAGVSSVLNFGMMENVRAWLGKLGRNYSQLDPIDKKEEWVNVLLHSDSVPPTGFMHMPQVFYRRWLTDETLKELESMIGSLVLEGPIHEAWKNVMNSAMNLGGRKLELSSQRFQKPVPSEEQFRSALEKIHSRIEALKTSQTNISLCSAVQARCTEIIMELSISLPYSPDSPSARSGSWIFPNEIGRTKT